MFIVLLKFAENKGKAREFMAGHNKWLEQGFEEGVFLLSGSLKASLGGGILAQASSLEALTEKVSADPFVANNVVRAEIIELAASKADKRLGFLLA